MNCVGKSADRRLAHVSFHLDERGGCLELLQCGETGVHLYECRPGSLHRVFELAPLSVAMADRCRLHQLVAVVGNGDRPDYNPRRVVVLSTASRPAVRVTALVFRTVVLGLAFAQTKPCLAVCTETSVSVFDIEHDHARMVGAFETRLNPDGLFALSGDGKRLAYPLDATEIGISDTGEQLLSLRTGGAFGKFKFNRHGDMLAVASADGTKVWVHRIESTVDRKANTVTWSETMLFELLRGTAAAVIESLWFNGDCSLLAVSGNSGTLHVFELSEANRKTQGFRAFFSSTFAPARSSLKLELGGRGSHLCAMLLDSVGGNAMLPGVPAGSPHSPGAAAAAAAAAGAAPHGSMDSERRILVACSDGSLSEYAIPTDGAGAAGTDEGDAAAAAAAAAAARQAIKPLRMTFFPPPKH